MTGSLKDCIVALRGPSCSTGIASLLADGCALRLLDRLCPRRFSSGSPSSVTWPGEEAAVGVDETAGVELSMGEYGRGVDGE